MLEPSGPDLWERIRDRLRENPLLLVYGGAVAAALFFIILIIVLVVVLSGGGDGDEIVAGSPTPTGSGSPTPAGSASPTSTPGGDVPSLSEVAPELTFFGDLAEVHSRPVTQTFNSAAASLTLADGSTLEVPDGAFFSPADVEIAIIDLRLDDYLASPLAARIYRLSAEEDIALGDIMVIDVQQPSDAVNVREFDGEDWFPYGVPSGSTTRIEIGQLSTRTFAVAEDASGSSLELGNVDVPSQVALDPLINCVNAVVTIISNEESADLYSAALSICADALSDASGDTVQTACMEDEISNGSTPAQAADICAGDDGETPAPTATPEPTDTPAPTPTSAPTPSPTKVLSGTLAGSTLSTEAVFEGTCTQQSEGADIVCSYQLLLTMDFVVSELPAQVRCRIEPQIPNFTPLAADTVSLSSLNGVVTLIPRVTARFDSAGNRLFSLPTLVECFLQRPIGAGEFQELDSILVDVELPVPDA